MGHAAWSRRRGGRARGIVPSTGATMISPIGSPSSRTRSTTLSIPAGTVERRRWARSPPGRSRTASRGRAASAAILCEHPVIDLPAGAERRACRTPEIRSSASRNSVSGASISSRRSGHSSGRRQRGRSVLIRIVPATSIASRSPPGIGPTSLGERGGVAVRARARARRPAQVVENVLGERLPRRSLRVGDVSRVRARRRAGPARAPRTLHRDGRRAGTRSRSLGATNGR